MESLPINVNHPTVRDYLALVRLQVLTPLSLLINIATVSVCSTVVRPGIIETSRLYPTAITPHPLVIAAYIMAAYILQIGYCILIVLAKKDETKQTIVKGVGLALVLANWIMAFWAIAWVLKLFLISTVLQGILLLLLVYSNLVLLIYHKPTSSRPFDTALIHAPLRFFLVLPLNVLFPVSLFVTLGLFYRQSSHRHKSEHVWPGFLVVALTNLLGLIVIVARRDIVWCVAAVWACVGLWLAGPDPALVFVTAILFTVLHPLALIASIVWDALVAKRRREGPIALPPDREDEPAGAGGEHTPGGHPVRTGAPREVDAEALWG